MTREELLKEKESMAAQAEKAMQTYHQALGAISVLDFLLSKLPPETEKPAVEPLSMKEFKERIGAQEVGEPVPLDGVK